MEGSFLTDTMYFSSVESGYYEETKLKFSGPETFRALLYNSTSEWQIEFSSHGKTKSCQGTQSWYGK